MGKVFGTVVLYKGESFGFGKKDLDRAGLLIKALSGVKVVVILQGDFGEEEKSFFKKLKAEIIENKKNLGFAGGHNVGIKYAIGKGAEYVLILNPDIDLHKDCIKEMLRTFKINP